MNVRWVLRHYRAWILMITVLTFTSMTVLTNMLQQLSGQEEPPQGTGRVNDERDPPDAHVRSIRNYQQVPREKFKILQVLHPIPDLENSISQNLQKGHDVSQNQPRETLQEGIVNGVKSGTIAVQDIVVRQAGGHNENVEQNNYEQQEGGPNYYEDNSYDDYRKTADDDDDDDDEDGLEGDEDTEEMDDEKESRNAPEDSENSQFQPGDFGESIIFQKPPLKYEEVQKSKENAENNLKFIQKEKQIKNVADIHVTKPELHNFNDNITIIPKANSGRIHDIHVRPQKLFQQLLPIHRQQSIHRKQSTVGLINPPYTQGIYWTPTAEQTVPQGISPAESERRLEHLRSQQVYILKPPTWNKCGRPMNGFVNLADGTPVCARYRTPHNKLILGEVLSFHLSRLLGLDNIPSVVLSWVNATSPQWKGINYTTLNWQENQVVALIDWIQDLNTQGSRVRIPKLIHEAYLTGAPLTATKLSAHNLTKEDLSQLVQWGDMIIFDYLTGNYDRFASMQDAAEKDNKPSIIVESVRNLRKSDKTGKMWLMDNESGLFDAYDLLYLDHTHKFFRFHRQMLQTMCIFRGSLLEKLRVLKQSRKPERTLLDFARSKEALLDSIPEDSRDKSYSLFEAKFAERINEVSKWEETCKGLSR